MHDGEMQRRLATVPRFEVASLFFQAREMLGKWMRKRAAADDTTVV
jgi:hypothetical protein